ncbi:hypothetical protein LXL04_038000 [Taraxacum kok-saghyz]
MTPTPPSCSTLLPSCRRGLHLPPSAPIFTVCRCFEKQTVFFLQTADVWTTSSSAELCRYGPQTADVLPLEKQTEPKCTQLITIMCQGYGALEVVIMTYFWVLWYREETVRLNIEAVCNWDL